MGGRSAVVLPYTAIALSSYVVPVAAVVLAFAFLGERPQPLQLVGGAVILAECGPRRSALDRR